MRMWILASGIVASTLAAAIVWAAPIDSNAALFVNGGGCYPTGVVLNSQIDLLTLIDPEWAPAINGPVVDSAPVFMQGTIQDIHGETGGDNPGTHSHSDVVGDILLDPADADRAASGNPTGVLAFEWEGTVFPAFAWPGIGDRVAVLGRWIFDCGHPDPIPGACSTTTSQPCALDGDCSAPACPTCVASESCIGAQFTYKTEMHPPNAIAAIRQNRGAVVSVRPGAPAVPATRADIYISDNGGPAGDACFLTHHANPLDLLSQVCYPLGNPVAQINSTDFVFDLPLPPRPPHGQVSWRITQLPAPGGRAAKLYVRRRLRASPPHLEVHVRMTHPTGPARLMPTGYAGTMVAGWRNDPSPMTHVRVTITDAVINNALQLVTPVSPKTCSASNTPCNTTADCASPQTCLGAGPVKGWYMNAHVNGQWQQFTGNVPGLDVVNTNDVIPINAVYDQFLPTTTGSVHFFAEAAAKECRDTLLGNSIPADLAAQGFSKGINCLLADAHDAGTIDVSYAGPDFGAGISGSTDYETRSVGGQGGTCSVTTATLCVVDADCPVPEICNVTGGAFSLRYTIERLL